MKRFFSSFWSLFIVAGLIAALDQWTKYLVRVNIPFAQQWMPAGLEWLTPYARLVHWHNSGAAFGMFQRGSTVFTVLAFVVIGLIMYYYSRVSVEDWIVRLALGMQMGGAAGNLISRLTLDGQVTDFISVGTFPVFNIADSSITVGVGVLLLGAWWGERGAKKQEKEQSSQEEQEAENQDQSSAQS
ncbi:MAG: signal peptidase II [Anaerolineales bacterium]